MGNRADRIKSPELLPTSSYVTELMREIRLFKAGRTYDERVTEQPVIPADKLKEEVERASKMSGFSFAPCPTCIDYTIFSRDEAEKLCVRQTVLDFFTSPYSTHLELDHALGCVFGMAVGDSWGHNTEFLPAQYDKIIFSSLGKESFKADGVLNKFGLKPGQFTDDTSMGLCLADTLLVKGHVDCIDLKTRFVMWWFLGYNNAFKNDTESRASEIRRGRSVGLGGQISMSLRKFLENPTVDYELRDENANGNGSIMRLAPLPVFYRNSSLDELAFESASQSFTTHSGLEAAECCILLSYVITRALKYRSSCGPGDFTGKIFLDSLDMVPVMRFLRSPVVLSIAESRSNYSWTCNEFNKTQADQDWTWKKATYKYSPTRTAINPGYVGSYCSDNLAMALHCVYHTTTFQDAVLRCINRCGDADSVGSVTGQIAGALYGVSSIPRDALECVMEWDNAEIGLRVLKMFEEEIRRK